MNYYETLGVSRNSEPEVIEAAYRALMKKYHPDRWQGDAATAEPRAQLINEAYATLRDPQRRRAYDERHPPEAPRSKKIRRKPVKTGPRPSMRQPVRQRARVQRFAMSGRAARRRPPIDDPMIPVLSIVACLGLMAMITLSSRGSSEAQLTAIGPVELRSVQASVLSGGRKQTVCITNKTHKKVDYSLYWGATSGRQFALDPGYYMIHSSPYSAAPLVEFFDNEKGEPARQVVKAAVIRGRPQGCEPNYSFEYKALDDTQWSGQDRYGLYGDERAEAAPPHPSTQNESEV